jgi:hypothetical protein
MSFDTSYALFPISEDEKDYRIGTTDGQEEDTEYEDSIDDTSSCSFLSFIKNCLRIICYSG